MIGRMIDKGRGKGRGILETGKERECQWKNIEKMKNYKRGKKFDNKDPIVTNHQVNLSNLIFLDK